MSGWSIILDSEPMKSVLMKEVTRRENLRKVLKRVCTNRQSPGIDGMTGDEIADYLIANRALPASGGKVEAI